MAPTQQGQQQPFMHVASQQFRPVGQGIPSSNIPMHPSQQQHQYSQPMHQLPPWSGQQGHLPPSSQAVPMQYVQPNRHLTASSTQPQQTAPPIGSHAPAVGASGVPFSSTYNNFVPSFGQPQNMHGSSQFQPAPQVHTFVAPPVGQPWLAPPSNGAPPVTQVQPTGQQPPVSSSDPATDASSGGPQSSQDWQEHTAPDGRRYYYNKRTRQSSWEKPFDLMTPIERADASTVWKEFTTPEGKTYYYNKVTKQSKWSIPEELKLARDQAQNAAAQGAQIVTDVAAQGLSAALGTTNGTAAAAVSVTSPPSVPNEVGASPVPLSLPGVPQSSGSSALVASSTMTSSGVPSSSVAMASLPADALGSTGVPGAALNEKTSPLGNFDNVSSQGIPEPGDGSSRDNEEAPKGMTAAGKNIESPLEEKTLDDEPLVFANKQEAKSAFKALLESANVKSDSTWEQAMREIVNDKRYGALKTLGERKQAFNEYLGQRKKIEAEERRIRQKKAREEFTKMLEESTELTSSMKWSKALSLFENDERFKAVEKSRDREDLFDNYVIELERKEREKAAEEHRRNVAEYRHFLESCDFIKVNSQWRKVQDRLEDDETCLRLEKLERLLIYQDYIRDLEREDEEQKKAYKEQQRRAERKNRDAFRKLIEEHVAAGTLTARTHWLDYCLKVKDLPEYQDLAENTSGSTPKELFEDVYEDLEKQYHEDKTHIKDAMKSSKITMVLTWSFEDFKAALSENIDSQSISDINMKLVYEDLVERAKEKEEKEAKKRQRLADDFTELLHSYKEITASSDWEESKPLFEDSQEYRAIVEEDYRKEIFEEYVAHLQEKAKEKERKREEEKAKKEKEREEKERRKEKERKEKEKEREREKDKGKERTRKDETDSETMEMEASDGYGYKEEKKRDKDRKHKKRSHSNAEDISSDKDEKEESRKSRRHGSDRKKSRKQRSYTPDSETESRHKKHRKDRDGSRRNDELEDGEVGEDGEIR
ncbi:Pre-mRNA-processing protein 40A [Linum grandiflorum]